MAFASLALVLCATCAPVDTLPAQRIGANDNRVPAGVPREDELSLDLELRRGRWYPEAEDGASEVVLAFAEAGRAPSIPEPLVRVRQGTRVTASIRNTLADAGVTIHGLGAAASPGDSVHVPAGAVRRLRFTADRPGTYFYWGSTSGAGLEKRTAE